MSLASPGMLGAAPAVPVIYLTYPTSFSPFALPSPFRVGAGSQGFSVRHRDACQVLPGSTDARDQRGRAFVFNYRGADR